MRNMDINLSDKLTALKGIGPAKAEAFGKMGIDTVEDLIFTFPVKYENRGERIAIEELKAGEPAIFAGKVVRAFRDPYRGKRNSILKLMVSDGTGLVEIVFFRGGMYMGKTFSEGKTFEFYGTPTMGNRGLQVIHPEYSAAGEIPRGIVPIYHLQGSVSQKEMRNCQLQVKDLHAKAEDSISKETEDKYNLCTLEYALEGLHFPESRQHYGAAVYRNVFNELLILQTGLMQASNPGKSPVKGVCLKEGKQEEEYIKSLSYELIGAQKRCIDEICRDMEKEAPMNRLVQGDVGSGKTAVAEAAMYKTVKCGYQAVLMAPTEILAKQHYEGFKDRFSTFGIEVGFLSGSMKKKEKDEVLSRLKSGDIDIIVGTHALIQPDVEYANLGLVVTDEQHRFGVRQRMNLGKKGKNPNMLLMTATPIPRTLAVIFFGDFDISVIDELPPGRKEITTKLVRGKREACYDFVEKQVSLGRQVYVVTPLIEESEALDVKSAEEVYEELKARFLNLSVDIVHGGMKQEEKDSAMNRFSAGETDVLVATVVIEVGINVPNATVMVVENAERFGLSQLHQLRGRVGRGSDKSYCFLILEHESETALKRCEIMEQSSDGFYISEEDLKLRGPGEILGTRQHGLPDLQITHMARHMDILAKAKEEAEDILKKDPKLSLSEHSKLKKSVNKIFGDGARLNL